MNERVTRRGVSEDEGRTLGLTSILKRRVVVSVQEQVFSVLRTRPITGTTQRLVQLRLTQPQVDVLEKAWGKDLPKKAYLLISLDEPLEPKEVPGKAYDRAVLRFAVIEDHLDTFLTAAKDLQTTGKATISYCHFDVVAHKEALVKDVLEVGDLDGVAKVAVTIGETV